LVKIEIDNVYRKLGNLFHLEIVSKGKVYRVPLDFSGNYNRGLTVYDKATGGRLACTNFGFDWEEVELDSFMLKNFIAKQFGLCLRNKGYLTSKVGRKFESSYVAYSVSREIPTQDSDIYKVFDGFEYRFVLISGIFYLCINPHLKIKIVASIGELMQKGLPAESMESLGAVYSGSEGKTCRCNIISLENDKCCVRNLDSGNDEYIGSGIVYLIPRPEMVQNILLVLERKSNIIEIQRQYSFLKQREGAKGRFAKTLEIASDVAEQVFPLKFADFEIQFVPKTISLRM